MQGSGTDPCDLPDGDLRQLVERAAQSDPDAWEQLYRRSYPRLFAYARRRLSSDTAADDAVSETMLRALDRIPSFTWQGAGFEAWLYGIIRNVVLETHRHDQRTKPAAHLLETATGTGTEAHDAIVRHDHHAEVRTAFDRLSMDDREILELRVVAELSAESIAQVTDRSAGAVRMAQSRALGRLRTHYDAVRHGR